MHFIISEKRTNKKIPQQANEKRTIKRIIIKKNIKKKSSGIGPDLGGPTCMNLKKSRYMDLLSQVHILRLIFCFIIFLLKDIQPPLFFEKN